jgi:hypothetical protein
VCPGAPRSTPRRAASQTAIAFGSSVMANRNLVMNTAAATVPWSSGVTTTQSDSISKRAHVWFALWFVVFVSGCERRDAAAEQQVAASATAGSAISVADCAISGRIDLALARNVAWMARARAQFLAKRPAAVERLQEAGLDIDALTREARFCELRLAGNDKSHGVLLRGDFPSDTLERASRAGKDSERFDSSFGEVVRVNTSWLGRTRHDLAWADRQDMLERVMATQLEDSEFEDHLLVVRMGTGHARPMFASIAEQSRLVEREWNGVVLWTARDNMSSGVRFLTNSQAATTRVLGALGGMLENLNQDPRTSALLSSTPLSVEGTDSGAVLRFQGSLEGLVTALATISKKTENRPSHDH